MNLSQIKEICVYIQELEKAYEFYHSFLGLEVIGRAEGRHIFFRAGASVLIYCRKLQD